MMKPWLWIAGIVVVLVSGAYYFILTHQPLTGSKPEIVATQGTVKSIPIDSNEKVVKENMSVESGIEDAKNRSTTISVDTPQTSWVSPECPPGKIYHHTQYIPREDGGETQYVCCIDPEFRCDEACNNCKSGKQTKSLDTGSNINVTCTQICVDCSFQSDCAIGFKCEHHQCLPTSI